MSSYPTPADIANAKSDMDTLAGFVTGGESDTEVDRFLVTHKTLAWVEAQGANAALQADYAEAAGDGALEAASLNNVYKTYDTKSDATADLANISDDDLVQVIVDEDQSNYRTLYRKQSGVLVYKVSLSSDLITVGTDNYRIGGQYGSMDSAVSGSWLFDGTSSYPNKLGINNTKPAVEPSWGTRSADSGYTVAGAADVGAVLYGYDNVMNALAGAIGSEHSMIYTGADHSVIFGGSLGTIGALATYSFIGSGTSNRIDQSCSYSVIMGGLNNHLTYDSGSASTCAFKSAIIASEGCASGGAHSLIANSYASTIAAAKSYNTLLGCETVTLTNGTHSLAVAKSSTVGASAASNYSVTIGNGLANDGSYSSCRGNASVVGVGHDYGEASGYGACTPCIGAKVFTARNRGNVAGNNQSLDIVFSNETTDNSALTAMYINGSTQPSMPANSVWSGHVELTAVRLSDRESSLFRIDFLATMGTSGATPTIKFTTKTALYDGLGLTTANVDLNAAASGILRARGKGLAATNIAWTGRLTGVHVGTA